MTVQTVSLRRSCCFTLIEMLVVVAIIVVLAALMMPSLQQALESARQLSCVNNVKSIGMAHLIYASDKNGMLPLNSGGSWDNARGWRLEALLPSYLGHDWPYNPGTLNCLGGVFICPSSPISLYKSSDGTNRYKHGSFMNQSMNSYAGNRFNSCGPGLPSFRVDYHSRPSRTPLHYCTRGRSPAELLINSAGQLSNEDWVGAAASWHGKYGPRPTVFLDGHAKVLLSDRYTSHVTAYLYIDPFISSFMYENTTTDGCNPYETNIREF